MGLQSTWRAELIRELEQAFPDAEVKPGERVGVSRDKPRINVFTAGQGGWQRDPQHGVVANPRMLVRYWPQRSKQPAPDTPHDPAELDDARDALLAVLRPLQATLAVPNLWYFLVEAAITDEDPAEWGVQVTLKGFAKNLAAIA